VGSAHHATGATGGADRARSGQYDRTPGRPQDPGQELLPGCGPLDPQACHSMFRPEVGYDAVFGPGALSPAHLGVAVSHLAVLAGQEA
jgi:hypothetical protein